MLRFSAEQILRSLWARFPDEAYVCPACASARIAVLDVIPTRDAKGRLVSFVTGCHECGLLFTNPQRSREELAMYYADGGGWADLVRKRKERSKTQPSVPKRLRRPDRLLSALDPYFSVDTPRPGAKVLDFGCGDGKLLDRLQDRGWATYGIETATNTAFSRHGRLERPPQDASFDLVVLHHVLEHMREPLDLLRQLAGATFEGGVLFISVPRLDTVPQAGHFKYCLDARKHPVAFSETCLIGLLARVGFAVMARLDARELDEHLTKGRPLRLRLIARRTSTPVPLPAAPLAPAVKALRQYRRMRPDGLLQSALLPVRMRAALMDHLRRRAKRRRRMALRANV